MSSTVDIREQFELAARLFARAHHVFIGHGCAFRDSFCRIEYIARRFSYKENGRDTIVRKFLGILVIRDGVETT